MVGASLIARLSLQRALSSFPARAIVAGLDGSRREMLYQGPMNSFVSRLRNASVLGAGASILAAPLALHYFGGGSWPWASNAFFLVGGECGSLPVT